MTLEPRLVCICIYSVPSMLATSNSKTYSELYIICYTCLMWFHWLWWSDCLSHEGIMGNHPMFKWPPLCWFLEAQTNLPKPTFWPPGCNHSKQSIHRIRIVTHIRWYKTVLSYNWLVYSKQKRNKYPTVKLEKRSFVVILYFQYKLRTQPTVV